MTFPDAVRTCFRKYAVISGRAPRSEYWWWLLFVVLASIGLRILDNLLFGATVERTRILEPLFSLAVLLPTICVGGRRLHDRDMSAWWLLLLFIPAVGQLVLLVLYALPGTAGPNRFGPDPLGPGRGGGTGAPPRAPEVDDESYTRSSIPRTGRTSRT